MIREVPEELLFALARKVAAGELSQEEANAALTLAAGEPAEAPPVVPGDTEDPALTEALAEATTALEGV